MESYRVNKIGTTKIVLDDKEGVVEPIPLKVSGAITDKQYETVENIISEFNKRFGDIDWGSDVDKQEAEKILIDQIPEKLKENLEILKSILNSDKANAKITSDEKVKDVMQNLMFTHTGIYKKFSNDVDFKNRYLEFIFDMMWDASKMQSGKVR